MQDLKGKNCFITGAASGIGRALAIGLAKEGMNLFITDINIENLEKVRNEIEKLELGVRVCTGKCDVSKYNDFENVSKEFFSKMEAMDLLINCAGIYIAAPADELELKDWKKVLDVNLWSVIHSIKVFLPRMLENKGGHIVNVSSAAGFVGAVDSLPYIASKFAVVGISEGLYYEFSNRGIEVSVILPSYIKTNIFRTSEIRFSKKIRESVDPKKLQEVEQLTIEEVLSISTHPDRAAKKYIKGIKNNELYIVDSKGILSTLIQKGTNPQKYKAFLRDAASNSEVSMKTRFLKVGINIDNFM